MSFMWVEALPLLLLVPVLVAVYIWMQRRRQRYAVRYASLSLVKQALGRGPGIRRHIPPALFLLSLAILILGFARPVMAVTLPTEEGTIILAMDVSGSMQATDMKPSRMEAAKAAATAFVQRQSSDVQIGIVAFSDNAILVQSPTNDQSQVLAAISRLTPQHGTAIGHGIQVSLTAIAQALSGQAPSIPGNSLLTPTPTPTPTPMPKGTFAPAMIVLLTDGENNEAPDPIQVAQTAADRGVRIDTVGVGSAAGTLIHISGETIRTSLDENTLKQIAQITSGAYYNASNEQDLKNIYENIGTQFVMKTEKTEITAIFTGTGLVLFLVAGALSLLWFNRLP